MEKDQPYTRKKLSRRGFLNLLPKTGAVVAGGALALRRWVDENGPAALLSDFLWNGGRSETPAEFLNEKEDPNPSFENPDRMLERSFQRYNALGKEDPSGYPTLSFKKRENYIGVQDVYERYIALSPKDIAGTPYKDVLGKNFVIALKILSPDGFERSNQSRGGDIIAFSLVGIDNTHALVALDPGSGFINRAIDKNFQTGRDKFYIDHPPSKGLSEEESEKMRISITEDLARALNYFKAEYAKSNEPIDLAEALIYFYKINQGDIYAGLWDSVMFFKLFVRNNLNTLLPESTLEQAMLLGKMFRDPFSPRNSLNWLVQKYQEKDINSSHPLAASSFSSSQQFKDFMLINRSGIYHGLNILTWAAVCMDPLLVEAVTTAYYGGRVGAIDLDNISEHGELKIKSDLIVAMKAPEIRQVVERNIKIL